MLHLAHRQYNFPMWHYRLGASDDWNPITIPVAWEESGLPKDHPGPIWFRSYQSLPHFDPQKRSWLRFHAVSYHCQIWVNGDLVGEHTGMWDSFSIEITQAVINKTYLNGVAEILLRVTKPASLIAGPESPRVQGEFPLRETLAGFLPYVWGHAFGGIWQPVEFYATGNVYIQDAYIRASVEGQIHLQVSLSEPASLHLQIFDSADHSLLTTDFQAPTKEHIHQFTLEHFAPWSPSSPNLYTAHLTLYNGDEKILRFGFCTLSTQDSIILLNKQPVYPRFILSWGWYPDRMCPDPGPERVRSDFSRLQKMGYNGVKLCLWYPPQYVFDIADELGMLLWVEFPIWLPEVTEFFRKQAPLEIERLTRLAHQHPSVILYTLGCELGPDIEPSFLNDLFCTVKSLIGDALLASNSGSGEAYDGPVDELADFYDHHFYTDPVFLNSLLDAFAPHWRVAKPWLMGEFNDSDTLRHWPFDSDLWWLSSATQGARWVMDIYEQEPRLQALGLLEKIRELHQISLEKALLHRKLSLEIVRSRPSLSGYVITGEADTPISTAGMWDDFGRSKFQSEEFHEFNSDTVLLLGFQRWREWVAGGDRPLFKDRYCYFAGDAVRLSLLVSHFGQNRERVRYSWEIGIEGQPSFASGTGSSELIPGTVSELGTANFCVPDVSTPQKLILRVAINTPITSLNYTIKNKWTLWAFPQPSWHDTCALIDPPDRLADLKKLQPEWVGGTLSKSRVGIITVWTPEAERFIKNGGRAVLLQGIEPGPLPVVHRPFWRECIQIDVPHPAWGNFPSGFGEQYYALNSDLALVSRPGQGTPLLRRLDTRQIKLEDYIILLKRGKGYVLVTTLRLEGGLGDQPSGITRSPAAMFLLEEWVRWLHL